MLYKIFKEHIYNTILKYFTCLLRILSTTIYVNTSNTIKKAKIDQILDVIIWIHYIFFYWINLFQI